MADTSSISNGYKAADLLKLGKETKKVSCDAVNKDNYKTLDKYKEGTNVFFRSDGTLMGRVFDGKRINIGQGDSLLDVLKAAYPDIVDTVISKDGEVLDTRTFNEIIKELFEDNPGLCDIFFSNTESATAFNNALMGGSWDGILASSTASEKVGVIQAPTVQSTTLNYDDRGNHIIDYGDNEKAMKEAADKKETQLEKDAVNRAADLCTSLKGETSEYGKTINEVATNIIKQIDESLGKKDNMLTKEEILGWIKDKCASDARFAEIFTKEGPDGEKVELSDEEKIATINALLTTCDKGGGGGGFEWLGLGLLGLAGGGGGGGGGDTTTTKPVTPPVTPPPGPIETDDDSDSDTDCDVDGPDPGIPGEIDDDSDSDSDTDCDVDGPDPGIPGEIDDDSDSDSDTDCDDDDGAPPAIPPGDIEGSSAAVRSTTTDADTVQATTTSVDTAQAAASTTQSTSSENTEIDDDIKNPKK